MDGKDIIKELCRDLRFDQMVLSNASRIYEIAINSRHGKKYKTLPLATGCLYFHCKSTGKPITIGKLLEIVPVDSEEIISIYNDLKRDALY